jgi:hypothetical protein
MQVEEELKMRSGPSSIEKCLQGMKAGEWESKVLMASVILYVDCFDFRLHWEVNGLVVLMLAMEQSSI